jgi:putative transposase
VWLPLKDVAEMIGVSEQLFQKKYGTQVTNLIGPMGYEVDVSALPAALQERCRALMPQEPVVESEPVPEPNVSTDTAVALCTPPPLDEKVSQRAETYVKAPIYNRNRCDTRTLILLDCDGLTGAELDDYVARRKLTHPFERLSVQTIYRWRKTAATGTLLANYGKRSRYSIVPDDLFEYFARLYMTEGRPSGSSCYMITVGEALKRGYAKSAIPSLGAFMRRLKNEIPQQSVCLARSGPSAYNRKFGSFVIRDYSSVLAGQCWVSDHVQIDLASLWELDGKTAPVFVWITVMRDFKSGLWVSWYPHAEPPNSDHIFAAFYLAAVKYGVPSTLYVDNGKDYRCKDLTGGRPNKFRIQIDESAATSMCAQLNIKVIFATPYNGQSKPVERDFLTNKNWFSKHSIGYRGGNVVERPESLDKKIKAGQIPTQEEVVRDFARYIREVFMIMPVQSKKSFRYGKSPVSMWNAEFEEASRRMLTRTVSKEALAMFCCRVSRARTIKRNGIYDSEILTYYFAEWMENMVGKQVYMRRAPGMVEEAWVFDSATHSLLGKADWVEPVPALVSNEADRVKLEKNLERIRKDRKLAKLYSDVGPEVSAEEKVENMAIYAKSLNPDAEITPISASQAPTILTPMDAELHKYKKRSEESGPDIDALARATDSLEQHQPEKKPVFKYEWELNEYLESKGMASAG